MTSTTAPLEAWASALLANMQPAQRKRLAGLIARDLRASNSQRMRAEKAPDGQDWEPRKTQTSLRSQRGRVRAAAQAKTPMMAKLRNARYLKTKSTANNAFVEFADKAARIANVHHEGKTDKVNDFGTRYQYPARELLGIAEVDLTKLRSLITDHLLSH